MTRLRTWVLRLFGILAAGLAAAMILHVQTATTILGVIVVLYWPVILSAYVLTVVILAIRALWHVHLAHAFRTIPEAAKVSLLAALLLMFLGLPYLPLWMAPPIALALLCVGLSALPSLGSDLHKFLVRLRGAPRRARQSRF